MIHNLHVKTLIGPDPSAVRVTLTAPDPQENDPWTLGRTPVLFEDCLEFKQSVSPICNRTALTYMYSMCSLLVDRRTP
jgi:hypothetical protein